MSIDQPIEHVLFLDIETVSQYSKFDEVPESFKMLWEKKAKFIVKEDETPEDVYGRSAIYAEFGKIVCISVGIVSGGEVRLKSFYGHNEKELLISFQKMLSAHYNKEHHRLCAHNGREFDIPYIARRMIVHQIELPQVLDLSDKKPWQVPHYDTMDMWKFGDYKHYTSLDLLAAIFNIPTPKDDIDGSVVGKVYWEEDDLERIKTYCQKDVLTTMQVMQAYLRKPLWKDNQINEVT